MDASRYDAYFLRLIGLALVTDIDGDNQYQVWLESDQPAFKIGKQAGPE